MVVLPAGTFVMGARTLQTETGPVTRYTEWPRRPVTIAAPFAIGRFEVTAGEWHACLADGGCIARRIARGKLAADQPAGWLSWHDATLYVRWLGVRTGQRYRLPSEAEWEYAARAGTETTFWWGQKLGRGNAHCRGCGSRFSVLTSAAVGSFAANAFGLHDVGGNVWEWVEDCWLANFIGAPSDGTPRRYGGCKTRVLRGGGFEDSAYMLHVSTRIGLNADNFARSNGLRVARALDGRSQ